MAAGREKGWSHVLMLAFCHAMSDFYATASTPLVETFKSSFRLSTVGVSVIGALFGIFGSMMQPLLGLWSDRTDRGALAALGLLVSAVFIGLMGLAPNAVVLTLLLIVGGLGVAAFHPGSAVLVVRGEVPRGLAMAVFMTGGGIGLALAPWVVTGIVDEVGASWLWVIMPAGVALSGALYLATRGEARAAAPPKFDWRALFARGAGPMWALFGMASVRALAVVSFTFYVSLLGKNRGWGLGRTGSALSWFMACGVVGNLLGGYLAERMGRRLLMAGSCLLAAPFFFVFAASSGPLSIPAFGVAGLLFSLANPVNVSLAQELRPQNASMVSGVMMGLAWGTASVLLLAVGALAEAISLETTLRIMAVLAGLAAVFVAFLPAEGEIAAE